VQAREERLPKCIQKQSPISYFISLIEEVDGLVPVGG
jgi:hypothetical protein